MVIINLQLRRTILRNVELYSSVISSNSVRTLLVVISHVSGALCPFVVSAADSSPNFSRLTDRDFLWVALVRTRKTLPRECMLGVLAGALVQAHHDGRIEIRKAADQISQLVRFGKEAVAQSQTGKSSRSRVIFAYLAISQGSLSTVVWQQSETCDESVGSYSTQSGW